MMHSQGKSKEERASTEQIPRIETIRGEILNTVSRVNDAIVKGVAVQPSVSVCLTKAFRQSWEHHWRSLLPNEGDIRHSGTKACDVTELVSADLFQGSRYTKDTWSIPKEYKESVIARLNSLLAPMELEIQSFHHNQTRVQDRNGFFDGLLRAYEIANHSREYKHSFSVEVRSVHHLRYREQEDHYQSRQLLLYTERTCSDCPLF